MHSLRERWRAYKYKLRYEPFYPNKSKEEILINPPANVDSNDWTAFVHHYKEDKMKVIILHNFISTLSSVFFFWQLKGTFITKEQF